MEFNASFGEAKKAITKEVPALLKNKRSEYSTTATQVHELLAKQVFTHETASSFIETLAKRAKGDIPSPILETLLIYQYRDNPSEEFSRQYVHSYNTKTNPKAKGIDLTLSYPASWKAREGKRPNVVQMFTSENGRGSESFLIMVKDLPIPAEYVVTSQELDEFFTASTLKEMLPPNSTFISAKPVMLENHKAGVILFDEAVERLDVKLKFRTQMYVTIVENKMIFLQFMASNSARFDKFAPLFQMVANSFIIQNQYNMPAMQASTNAVPVSRSAGAKYSDGNLILSIIQFNECKPLVLPVRL